MKQTPRRNIFHIKGNNPQVCCIFICAGHSRQIKSFGNRSMTILPNGQRLIDRQMQHVDTVFPNNTKIVISGYHSDRLLNYLPNNIVKIENEHYDSTNYSRSLGIALRATTSPNVVIVDGDTLFNEEALRFNLDNSCVVIGGTNTEEENDNVGCNIDRGCVEIMIYGLPNKWARISYFSNKDADLLRKLTWDRNNDRKYAFEIFNTMIESGSRIVPYINKKTYSIDVISQKSIDIIKETHY